eukprot:SAG22_NODE_1503_length_4277_cov_18.029440_2_plen_83_part_00
MVSPCTVTIVRGRQRVEHPASLLTSSSCCSFCRDRLVRIWIGGRVRGDRPAQTVLFAVRGVADVGEVGVGTSGRSIDVVEHI